MKYLMIMLLAGCDFLDGDIEEPANCCALLTEGAVRKCFRDFVDEGTCRSLSCPTVDLYEPKGCDETGGVVPPP